VLPLANLSGEARDAALVDGLTEELIGVLARIEGLQVVARTSAFAFRGTSLDVRSIADSLHVSNVLEGGVQRIGDRLRVQVRLIDARDGSTRWSETYDRELRDVFVVQSDIATAVARELNLRLASDMGTISRPRAVNIAAYELVLRGNDPSLLRNDSAVVRGLEYFQHAAAIDSTYAAAFAGMSRMYLRLRWTDLLPISSREKYELARDAALKAISLDPSLADAHASVGLIHLASGKVPEGLTALKRAVALDPGHSRIREWLSFGYSITGRHAEALAETLRAVENDPLSPSANAEVGRALCLNGQITEGLARLNTLDALQPPLARAVMYKAMCHGMSGDWETASAILPRGDPRIGAALAGHVMARVGKKDSAQAVLDDLTRRWERTRDGAFLIAIVYAGFGDREQTFEWLNRSIDEASLSPQLMFPFFDDMTADPRFEQFRRRLGIQNR
jgi:TolB-like protein/Flp pilus assembly protein TadD